MELLKSQQFIQSLAKSSNDPNLQNDKSEKFKEFDIKNDQN
jgi:hypothetical protein